MKDDEFEEMKSLSQKIGKGLKTQEDLARFTQALTKMSVEAALNAELDHHLGYEKGTPKVGTNSRNDLTSKVP